MVEREWWIRAAILMVARKERNRKAASFRGMCPVIYFLQQGSSTT
jgi:hypothetical protein